MAIQVFGRYILRSCNSYYGKDVAKRGKQVSYIVWLRLYNYGNKEGGRMKKSMKDYKRKIKTREVAFYLSDESIYKKSKEINFQAFVKTCLKNYDLIMHELYYAMKEGE